MAASTKKSMEKINKRKKLEDQSVDEFLAGFTNLDSSDSGEPAVKKVKQNKKLTKGKMFEKNMEKKKKDDKGHGETKGLLAQHKSSLDKLKDHDPEFYDFLQKEDESLLKFEVPDSDVTDTSDDDDDDDDERESDADQDDGDDLDDEDIDIPMSSDDESDDAPVTKKDGKKDKGNKMKDEKDKKKKKEKLNPCEAKSKSKEANLAAKKGKTDGLKEKQAKDNEKAKKQLKGKKNEEDITVKDFNDIDVDTDSDEEMYHQPPETLETMSDAESGDDDDADDANADDKDVPKGKKVTLGMIEQWTQRLKAQPSPVLITTVAHVLRAAVQKTSRESEETKFTVIGGTVFNAVIKMCLVDMPAALHKFLNLQTTTDLQKPAVPSTNDKRWIRIRNGVKSYLSDILKLMSEISQVSMVNVLLKHLHKLVAFFTCDSKLTKALLKKAISVWSTGEETSRVLAFLIINRLIKVSQGLSLEDCIKKLYMAYVRNCKFTSPNTLPLINFMQRSFVEIISLDIELAYQYTFMYIRQLAIHLRNATSIRKKESVQAVYNWQYIHCLSLWSRVISMTYPNEILEPLIYPLVQTVIGTIKLIPTQKYYPLRFHCVQALTMISKSTNIYIPVLPFLLEVFEQTDFNKKHKAINFKPFNFACILKFSKTQLQERAFKDGVIDQLYELLLEFLSAHAHTIGFPELVLPAQLQLKDFLKNCKVGNFTKQIKQIYDKICENSHFISARRGKTAFNLSDTKSIEIWERQCKDAGTPIGKYYTSWRKLRDRELMHQIAAKDQIVGEDTVPEIVRPKLPQKATDEDKKEFAALFDSDSDENEIDFSESFLPPAEKRKLRIERKQKQGTADKKEVLKKKEDGNKSDEYSDFDSDELEQLAGSGDDDDDDDVDDDNEDDDNGVDDESDDKNDGDDMDDEEADSEEKGVSDDDDDDDDDKEDIVEDFSFSSDDDSS